MLGHNGLDPGVSAVVAHHLAAATTIIVVGNQGRGSWPVYLRLAADLELTDPRLIACFAGRPPPRPAPGASDGVIPGGWYHPRQATPP